MMKTENGYQIRPAAMDDLEAAVETFNAFSLHTIGAADTTLEDIRAEWLLPEFNLEKSTRVALAPDGRLAAYVEVWDIQELPVRLWVWGRVHPEHENRGLGTRLMKWAEARARQALNRVPDDLRVVYQAGTLSNYEPAHRLFKDLDMKLTRHFWTMVIDMDGPAPAPGWPEGVTVRSMLPGEERAVIQSVRDAFRDHWGYVEQPFEQEFERWQHFMANDKEFDPALWFLALDGDEIAGVSLCRLKSHEDPKMGWVNTLGVRRPWRKRGLGLALLQHSFAELQQRGQERAGLGVDASSLTGATRLYEKAGMRVLRQFDNYEKELRPGKDVSTQTVED
jgi:mycothiol synthase